MAYNINTGEILDWAPTTNGTINTIAASADGQTLYLGGEFTTLNDQTAWRVGAVRAADGQRARLGAAANGSVKALSVSADGQTLYIGGAFTQINSSARQRAAAINLNTQQLTGFASRMVDAQAPGVARRLTALSRLTDSSPDWPERLLDELGLLHLLIRAWTRREQLPDDLGATVRSHVGITVRTEDVLASPGIGDTWVVVAGRDTVEGRLAERRLWLYGTTTRRWALILAFAPVSGGFSTTVVPGTRFDAVAHFYPGRGPALPP